MKEHEHNDYEKKSEIKRILTSHLDRSAYRKGASAYMYGGLRGGVSDHLPVKFDIKPENFSENISAVTWNMLSDAHLWNNFMNITGSELIKSQLPEGNIYKESNNLYHFFCEISQYLYNKLDFNQDSVILSDILRQDFDKKIIDLIKKLGSSNTLDLQSSMLARSRDTSKEELKQSKVKKSRSEIINKFMEVRDNQIDKEFLLSIKHSLEMVYHILNDEGALRWKNRFNLLKEDKELLKELITADVLCLQECTNPDDILNLLNEKSGNKYNFISYHIGRNNQDNCVLIYNSNRFRLFGKRCEFALGGGKKPGILAFLQNKIDGQMCLFGSIHHPGGKKYEFEDIKNLIQDQDTDLPCVILGDHNNTKEYFDKKNLGKGIDFSVNSPNKPTMAGRDHGIALNSTIDLASTLRCEVESKEVILTKFCGGVDCAWLDKVEEQVVTESDAQKIQGAFFGSEDRLSGKNHNASVDLA